jgi:hypothetical protein
MDAELATMVATRQSAAVSMSNPVEPSNSSSGHSSLVVFLALIALAVIGLLYFPGTQYLTSDTQIYVPLLEHRYDPTVLTKDPLVHYPHLGLSLYDEIVTGIRRVTGWDVHTVVYLHQVFFRLVQLFAAYWIALGIGCGRWHSLWIAAMVEATAFVSGPSVMVVEYDAVPRGYTFSLAMLAIACVAYGRLWLASIAAGVSLFFQGGTAYPFLLCFGPYLLLGRRDESPLYRLRFLLPVMGGLLLVAGSAISQGGASDTIKLVPDWLEELQRLRASYNYPSTWHPAVLWVPVALSLVSMGAWWRIRHALPSRMHWFLLGTTLVGLLSIPVAWFLMEDLRLFLAAQLQPARAVAFMYAIAIPVIAAAGFFAIRQSRFVEAFLWFTGALAIPFSNQLVFFVGANGWPTSRYSFLWAPAIALLALMVFWLWARRRTVPAILLGVILALAPFYILRDVLGTNAFATDARNTDVSALAEWAAANTPKDAVFAFPGFGRSNHPGVFRSEALRAVYSDWKSGGQVNFSADFARVWWERWNQVMKAKEFSPSQAPYLRNLGIDYLVVPPPQVPQGIKPEYQNEQFSVFRTESIVESAPTSAVNSAAR